MDLGDLVMIVVWFIGTIVGIIYSIWNWKNPEVDGLIILGAPFVGGVIAWIVVGISPLLIVVLLAVGLDKLRGIEKW